MSVKLLSAAKQRLQEIWRPTAETWGEGQASVYLAEMEVHLLSLEKNRLQWRISRDPRMRGVFFSKFRSHVIFFKEFASGNLGNITILQEKMDLPNRLREDLR